MDEQRDSRKSLINAIIASLKNGDRLLFDADLLLSPEHAPTVYALSILAQEEFAKAFILYLVETNCMPWDDGIRKTLKDHQCKQLMGLIMDFLNPEIFLERMNLKHKNESFLPPHILDTLNIIRHEMAVRNGRNNWREPEDASCDPTARKIADGKLEQSKQDAIYVRVGRLGDVISEPSNITISTAKNEFEKAQRLARILRYYDGKMEGPIGLDFEKISSVAKVLFGLMSVEEFSNNWWL